MAPWLLRLPSLGKAHVVSMWIYGELGWTAWFPKCPSFIINSGLSGHTLLQNFFLSLTESEFTHDEASRFGRHCIESIR